MHGEGKWRSGDLLPVTRVWATGEALDRLGPGNLVSGIGLSGPDSPHDVHDNALDGATMWLARGDLETPLSLTFDLGGAYALGEMWVWNYNQQSHDGLQGHRRGIRRVAIDWSLDSWEWIRVGEPNQVFELACADGQPGLQATNVNDGQRTPICFHNAHGQFIRWTVMDGPGEGNWGGIDGNEPFYGLSAVRFYAGRGWMVDPAPEWTELFHRRQGWAGADGIYSTPLQEESDPAHRSKTLFIFGDTFVGAVDAATDRRLQMTMINNSAAILEGDCPDPHAVDFVWRRRETSPELIDESLVLPRTPRSEAVEGSYYWLQAGARVADRFHCLPIIVGPNPQGPEGFQFAVHGITLVTAPIEDGVVKWEQERQIDTSLYHEDADGTVSYFGAGIFDNAGPLGDGWVYIYGLRTEQPRSLLVARVLAEAFERVAAWRFWDGHVWSEDMVTAVPILRGVSSEFSLAALTFGPKPGYVLIHGQGDLHREYVTASFAKSPFGPFSPPERLYYCAETAEAEGAYAYNPKAHPALSAGRPSLLLSYNVNTTSWNSHVYHASVYRPRFVRLSWSGEASTPPPAGSSL